MVNHYKPPTSTDAQHVNKSIENPWSVGEFRVSHLSCLLAGAALPSILLVNVPLSIQPINHPYCVSLQLSHFQYQYLLTYLSRIGSTGWLFLLPRFKTWKRKTRKKLLTRRYPEPSKCVISRQCEKATATKDLTHSAVYLYRSTQKAPASGHSSFLIKNGRHFRGMNQKWTITNFGTLPANQKITVPIVQEMPGIETISNLRGFMTWSLPLPHYLDLTTNPSFRVMFNFSRGYVTWT